MKWARRTMFDKRSINIDWTLAWRVWLRNHCLRSWYMAMTWAEWMVSREQPGCDGDGNGWSKSTFTNAAHVMRGPSSADTWHDARTARQKYKWWKYLSLLKCPRFFGADLLRNLERGASVTDCTNFYEIPDCCFEARGINHGNIATFSPLAAEKRPISPACSPAITWVLTAQMQVFCWKPEVTCPRGLLCHYRLEVFVICLRASLLFSCFDKVFAITKVFWLADMGCIALK